MKTTKAASDWSEPVSKSIKRDEKSGKAEWTPPEGFFSGSPAEIAHGLFQHSNSHAQAASRLSFYRNRAGKNLPSSDRDRLQKAADALSDLYKHGDKSGKHEENPADKTKPVASTMKGIVARLQASAEMDKAIVETQPEPECLPWLFALGEHLTEAAAIETETCTLTYLTESGWTSVVAVGYSSSVERFMATACLFRDDGCEVANLNSQEDGVVMSESLSELMTCFKEACQSGIDRLEGGEFGDTSTPTNVHAMNWLLQLRNAADLAGVSEIVASFGSFRVNDIENEEDKQPEADVIVIARLTSSAYIKAAWPHGVREFTFRVRTEEDGKGGVSTKTVEAKDSAKAWVEVVKYLNASGLLTYVTDLNLTTPLNAAFGNLRSEGPYEWFQYQGADDVLLDSQGRALRSGQKFGVAPASIGEGRFIHMVIDAPGLGLDKVLTVAADTIRKLTQKCKRMMF